jgi:hypothetical protein
MRAFVFLVAVVAFFVGIDISTASAQDVEIYCETKDMIEGGVGQSIGILVALTGLITFLRGSMFGLILMVCGALVTLSPAIVGNVLNALSNTGTGGNQDKDFLPPC